MSYIYLGASLPALVFDAPPAITTAAFLDAAQAQLGAREYARLATLTLLPSGDWSMDSLAGRYYAFETALRNKLARMRANELKRDAEPYLKEERELFADLESAVANAVSAPDPLARERALDRLRFARLDLLEGCHQFDFDFFCAYKLKLAILEKTRDRDAARGRSAFDFVVEEIGRGVNAQLNYGDQR